MDAVPLGELGDHEQADAAVGQQAGDIDLVGVGEQGVHPALLADRHAESAVLDLDGEPGGDEAGPQQHLGVGSGEHRGVLDEFGEQVDDVGDGVPAQGAVDRRYELDPGVLLDLGDGRAQHLGRGDRVAPLPPGDGPAEHGEVLGVAADAGGEVVDVEEALEQVGVLDLVLQLVEDRDLPVHQRLQAPGEVDEHLELLFAARLAGEPGRLHDGGDGAVVRAGEVGGEQVEVVGVPGRSSRAAGDGGGSSPRRSPLKRARRSASLRAVTRCSGSRRSCTDRAGGSAATGVMKMLASATDRAPPSTHHRAGSGRTPLERTVNSTAAQALRTTAVGGRTARRSNWGRMCVSGSAGAVRAGGRPCRPPSRRSGPAAGARRPGPGALGPVRRFRAPGERTAVRPGSRAATAVPVDAGVPVVTGASAGPRWRGPSPRRLPRPPCACTARPRSLLRPDRHRPTPTDTVRWRGAPVGPASSAVCRRTGREGPGRPKGSATRRPTDTHRSRHRIMCGGQLTNSYGQHPALV